MSIMFSSEDWARVRENYNKWWNKSLERPLIKVTIQNDTTNYNGNIPLLSQSTCHRLDISPDDVIARINVELERQEYLGDSFPMVNFDIFGPGVLAAFLGAELNNSTGNVWFHPKSVSELKNMHFEYNSNSIWLNRIKDIYRAGEKKWQGNVLMGMPDLGGILDVLAVFRGSDNLLYDLYDEPEEVKRLSKELQTLWLTYYKELEEVLQPINPGYSDWSGLYCSKPSYVVQCDFSYMIGPDMFKEFVAEDLSNLCSSLTHTLYHMDGKGELPHLPQLIEINQLDAIQWCPGDGVPRTMEWMDIYKTIRLSGKNMHILGDETDFTAIAKEIGSKGLYLNLHSRPLSERDNMMKLLKEFNVCN